MEEILTEDHIVKRGFFENLFNLFLVLFYSFFFNIMSIVFILSTFNVDLLARFSNLVLFVFPVICFILYIIRIKLILRIFKQKNIEKIYSSNQLAALRVIFVVIYVGVIVTVISPIANWPVYIDLLLALFMGYILIETYLLYPMITEKGTIFIEFYLLKKYQYDFSNQSKWLEKICTRIETKFKKNGMNLPKEQLFYKINNLLLEQKSISFDEIEEWFMSDKSDFTILSKIKNVISDIETSPYKKPTIMEQIKNIPYKEISYIISFTLLIVLILIYSIYPEPNSEALIKIIETLKKIIP